MEENTMPYITSTTDEFLAIAYEAAVGGKNHYSVDQLLEAARKKLSKKLKTVDACDEKLAAIKNESTKFNECIKTLAAAKKKFDAGKITPKEFDRNVKSAVILLNKNCKNLQCKLGNFVDDSRAVTSDEVAAFNAYIKGLVAIVNDIKKDLKKKAKATEGTFSFDMYDDDEIYIVTEGADEGSDEEDDEDSDDEDDEDDDKDDKKKSKKSKKKSDDDDDDDDDGEEEDSDDDDDKKSKKKSSKSKKDDDDDNVVDDDLGLDFGDKELKDDEDDEDNKKSKKSKKKSDDDDEDKDDEDSDDDDDDKKSKKKSSESAYDFSFYNDDIDDIY